MNKSDFLGQTIKLDISDYKPANVNRAYSEIIKEANKRGINVEVVANKYLELELNGVKKIMYYCESEDMSAVTKMVLCSKQDTKVFLKRKKLSVAEGRRFEREDVRKIVRYVKSLGSAVIKPDGGDKGKYVYCNIEAGDAKEIISLLPSRYKRVVVERFVIGNEYRIYATKLGYTAISVRIPANVKGDGVSSVLKLIEKKNKMRKRRKVRRLQIIIDDIMLGFLNKCGRSLDYVAQKNEVVFLRGNSNVSTGGECIDMTDVAHPSVKEIAMRVLDSIPGLQYAGIDIITADISKDISNNYTILEINNMPGMGMHLFPDVGRKRNVAGALLDLLFSKSPSSS
jgi:cyanophycin synthetase